MTKNATWNPRVVKHVWLKYSVESTDFLTKVVEYSVHTMRKLIFLQILKILAIAASL